MAKQTVDQLTQPDSSLALRSPLLPGPATAKNTLQPSSCVVLFLSVDVRLRVFGYCDSAVVFVWCVVGCWNKVTV
jgi:hypothetical protein